MSSCLHFWFADGFAETAAIAIASHFSTETPIDGVIKNWNNYNYGSPTPFNVIENGGDSVNPMYNNGNQVRSELLLVPSEVLNR